MRQGLPERCPDECSARCRSRPFSGRRRPRAAALVAPALRHGESPRDTSWTSSLSRHGLASPWTARGRASPSRTHGRQVPTAHPPRPASTSSRTVIETATTWSSGPPRRPSVIVCGERSTPAALSSRCTVPAAAASGRRPARDDRDGVLGGRGPPARTRPSCLPRRRPDVQAKASRWTKRRPTEPRPNDG